MKVSPSLRNLKSGDRFSMLVAANPTRTLRIGKEVRRYWLFTCDCGKEKEILGRSVIVGFTKSCGCYSRTLKRKKSLKAPGEASLNKLFKACMNSARERKIEFNISRNFHDKVIVQICYYCGAEPIERNAYLKKDGTPRFSGSNSVSNEAIIRSTVRVNGIDRINNALGYVESNCVACCEECNEMKMDRSVNKFLEHVRKINNYQSIIK